MGKERIKNKYMYIYGCPSYRYSHNPKTVHRFGVWNPKTRKRKEVYSNLDLEKVVKFRNEYLQKHYPHLWEKVKQEELL